MSFNLSNSSYANNNVSYANNNVSYANNNESTEMVEINISEFELEKYSKKSLNLRAKTNVLFNKYSSTLGELKTEIKNYIIKLNKLEKSVLKSKYINDQNRKKLITDIKDTEQKLTILVIGAKYAANKDCFFRKYELIVVNIIITSTVLVGIFFLAILIWLAQ